MKINYYNAPECEIVKFNLGNQILVGSEFDSNFGILGEAGEVPVIDPEIVF